MHRFAIQNWTVAESRRDRRVDVLRGFALLMIFIDHVPGDWLNNITMRNFGFCDAAEIFVLLAGFASMSAYGKCFERQGARSGLWRVCQRCARLWLFQLGLLLATLALRRSWLSHYGVSEPGSESFLGAGLADIAWAASLRALPPGLDILPLYIVLLTCFPFGYAAARLVGPFAALAASAALWAAANLLPGLNFVNAADGTPWHFNPFAWQFLFAIGAVLAIATQASGGSLPRRTWVVAGCWAYLGWALLQAAPWTVFGLPDLGPWRLSVPDKTALAPVRLLDVLAIAYLVLSSRRLTGLVRHRAFAAVEACGKHSLEVFSLGTLLSLAGQLAMQTFGDGLGMQIGVNLLGFGIMLTLGLVLERGLVSPPASLALAAVRHLRR
ncbi:MAG: OpgC domain-containing protein [Alphaproteobacteria bacterium]|nr:OpgC domain-containing protein [Alphaproteobacteria bacterium]